MLYQATNTYAFFWRKIYLHKERYSSSVTRLLLSDWFNIYTKRLKFITLNDYFYSVEAHAK